MNKIIKISIVDDETLFVEGLCLLLSHEKNITIVSTASSGLELLDTLSKASSINFPTLVLVDIQMKPMNGYELVDILKEKHPDLKIIVVSSHYKKNIVGHMIKLGVSAFIPKNTNKKALIETIKSVAQYGVYFTQQDQKMLISYMNSTPKRSSFSAIEELTSRETEILKLICHEQTNQEIANNLFLSKRTIESHRQRILDKVGAKNTVGLVVYAIVNNIHPLPNYPHTI